MIDKTGRKVLLLIVNVLRLFPLLPVVAVYLILPGSEGSSLLESVKTASAGYSNIFDVNENLLLGILLAVAPLSLFVGFLAFNMDRFARSLKAVLIIDIVYCILWFALMLSVIPITIAAVNVAVIYSMTKQGSED